MNANPISISIKTNTSLNYLFFSQVHTKNHPPDVVGVSGFHARVLAYTTLTDSSNIKPALCLTCSHTTAELAEVRAPEQIHGLRHCCVVSDTSRERISYSVFHSA